MTIDINLLRTIKPIPGGFVRTPDKYVIGKLMGIEHGRGRVAFRQSTVAIEEHFYTMSELQRFFLSPQTRVYWLDKSTDKWRSGRVTDYFIDPDGLVYTVRFPNQDDQQIPERELETRSLLPNQDPVDALAEGWCETQFFFDRRKAALNVLVRARTDGYGLTGLLSASVELLPHQVDVVRRVLTDPIQRYLLADEVGLGKTIEAGSIIRQCLLDDPSAQVMILTPPLLVKQWERELSEKFGIHQFPGRVSVRPFDSLWELYPPNFNTLVIDEAHHLLETAGSNNAILDSPKYQLLAKLTHACQRLLVITATPVFGDETAMLGLLHLLDPSVHSLEERAAFRQKLARRQEYGRLLMALDPAAKPFILKRLGTQFLETFPEDETIIALAQKLVDSALVQPKDVENTVRLLKKHIAETYRLHQRLLRTRRKDLVGWELQPRQGIVRVVAEQNANMRLILNYLEDWRYHSFVAVQSQAENTDIDSLKLIFARRFKRLFEAAGQSIEELSVEIDQQWQSVISGQEPTFPDEKEIVLALQNVLADSDPNERLTLAVRTIQDCISSIKRPVMGSPKIVVFTSSSKFARQMATCLSEVLGGRDTVCLVVDGLSSSEVDDALEIFKNGNRPLVLVCDKNGEEGLNLHFADAVVHLDFPLAPARIEQRIGRVDRFGRHETSIQHAVILPSEEPDSPWRAWYEVLQKGFEVFDNSISDVQFLLENLQTRFALDLYQEGSVGLTKAVDWVHHELEKERARLDEQYALDQLAMAEEGDGFIFDNFEAADDKSFYEEMDAWLVETLKLKRERNQQSSLFNFRWTEHTLMPKRPWHEVFQNCLNQEMSYDRTVAVNHAGVCIVRPGSQLLDAVEHHLLWDDRGTSFATWRVDSRWNAGEKNEWTGFQLLYVIEFNVDRVIELLKNDIESLSIPTIRRRADALFPPWIEVLTLDTSLNEVLDPLVSEILQPAYKSRKDGQRDYNLGGHNEIIFSLIPRPQFHDLCIRVRQRSEKLVWESQRFCKAVEVAARRAEHHLITRNQQLKWRGTALFKLEGTDDATIRSEIAINNAVLRAAEKPNVRLDAIGFFVISDRPPEGGVVYDK